MSALGDAASLFGTDGGDDPFSVVGQNALVSDDGAGLFDAPPQADFPDSFPPQSDHPHLHPQATSDDGTSPNGHSYASEQPSARPYSASAYPAHSYNPYAPSPSQSDQDYSFSSQSELSDFPSSHSQQPLRHAQSWYSPNLGYQDSTIRPNHAPSLAGSSSFGSSVAYGPYSPASATLSQVASRPSTHIPVSLAPSTLPPQNVELFRTTSKSAYDPPVFSSRYSALRSIKSTHFEPSRPPTSPLRMDSTAVASNNESIQSIPPPPRPSSTYRRALPLTDPPIPVSPNVNGVSKSSETTSIPDTSYYDVLGRTLAPVVSNETNSNLLVVSQDVQNSVMASSDPQTEHVHGDVSSQYAALHSRQNTEFNPRWFDPEGSVNNTNMAPSDPYANTPLDNHQETEVIEDIGVQSGEPLSTQLSHNELYTPRMRASTESGRAVVSDSFLTDTNHIVNGLSPPFPQALSRIGAVSDSPLLAAQNKHSEIEGLPYSSAKPALYDPYAPPIYSRIPSQDVILDSTDNEASVSSVKAGHSNNTTPSPLDSQTVAAPLYTQYAPSPSLLGTNDPLSRTSTRAPIFSFGFGGRAVSCFHLSQISSGGFDVAMSSQEAKHVCIRGMHDIIPASPMEEMVDDFPGPLFADPNSPGSGLITSGASSNSKTKKLNVLKYLDDRIATEVAGVGHIALGTPERYQAESKLLLIQLLRVLVDNDGSLSGSPGTENKVRQLLNPVQPVLIVQNALSPNTGLTSSDAPLVVSTLRTSNLTQLTNLLLLGDRHEAYRYAVAHKLWAHALLLSHGLDKEVWNEAVVEFLRSEFPITGSKTTHHSAQSFDALKVAYALSAGLGAASIQQLSPNSMPSAQSLPLTNHTPLSPSLMSPPQLTTLPMESLLHWREIASVIFGNSGPVNSSALTALGDQLVGHGWVAAAHCCYLLSPHTSSLGAAGVSSSRAVLLGSANPLSHCSFHKARDPFLFTEMAEFALSLAPVQKGQDPYAGLAHLQAYRLIRAYQLADLGHTTVALRYCEAIGATLRQNSRGSSMHNSGLIDHLNELSDRLTGAPHDKNKTWTIGKVAKPSIDNLSGWLIKSIVGEGDGESSIEQANLSSREKSVFAGAFSTYSAISSAGVSQSPSPSPSLQAQRRYNSPPFDHHPTLRSSSAMDYSRPDRKGSPSSMLVASSAGAITSAFPQNISQQLAPALKDYGSTPGTSVSNGPWWSDGQETSAGRTPTATTFFPIESARSESGYRGSVDEIAVNQGKNGGTSAGEESDDELGLGNSDINNKHKNKRDGQFTDESKSTPPPQQQPTTDESKPELKHQSSSWLGWIWKRGESTTPAPIKAKLGEESSFYYDKELKRWVNGKAGADSGSTASTPPPPPPPSRQATAPPGVSVPHKSHILSQRASGPPMRPASAIDLGSAQVRISPLRVPMGVVEGNGDTASAPPSPPSRLTPSAPPSGRTKSAMNKRSVRSRYVDVFQQEQNAS